VDEMMTEDNNLALPTQQVPMDHQVQSNEQNQPPHHLALLRSNCPGSSDVNVVQASESESHSRISLDSNKSFQEMDLSEDVVQTSTGMLH
jgi:hypothetical protein